MALVESQATLHCIRKAGLYPVGMSIGKRIELARTRLPMTRKALGEKVGLTEQAVFEWERKGKRPDPDHWAALRRVLRVPYAYLIEGKGKPPPIDDGGVRQDDLLSQIYELMPAAAEPAPVPEASPKPAKKPRKRRA